MSRGWVCLGACPGWVGTHLPPHTPTHTGHETSRGYVAVIRTPNDFNKNLVTRSMVLRKISSFTNNSDQIFLQTDLPE